VRTIYFDYNATTPLDPESARPCCHFWENSSAILPAFTTSAALPAPCSTTFGSVRQSAWLQTQPDRLYQRWNESNNLAILGAARRLRDKGRHLITSPVEHHAVLNCFEHLARERRVHPVSLAR